MKQVTNLMINEFRVMERGIDFMGYDVKRKESLSFHHLIIARRNCARKNIPNDGYVRWNGSILVQDTSHNYLHAIERVDEEIFYLITSEMIDQNLKGRLDKENLLKIKELLEYFEREHSGDITRKGKPLIKPEYIRDREIGLRKVLKW